MKRRKVLLDECIDSRLVRKIPEHEVKTVPKAGWAGLKNGKLLVVAQELYDVFVTVDRNLTFQQNLTSYKIAIVVLTARSNKLVDLEPLVPQLVEVIETLQPGQIIFLGS